MKSKHIQAAVLVAAVGCTVASVFVATRMSVEKSARPKVAGPAQTERQPAAVPAEAVTALASEMSRADVSAAPEKTVVQPNPQNQNAGNSANPKEEIQDPDARMALSFVGADPDAEEYWVAAINDASLSANERKDLIEDLNEDGLSDPKHPGSQDLPLIVNRLRLIEELAPFAKDQINADAFAEAYKDLNNLLAGQPVQ
jgi:hypothetical protein